MTLLAQRGGTGKTTLAIHLSVAAEAAGWRAALVDLDPQASAAGWGDHRGEERPAVAAVPQPVCRTLCRRPAATALSWPSSTQRSDSRTRPPGAVAAGKRRPAKLCGLIEWRCASTERATSHVVHKPFLLGDLRIGSAEEACHISRVIMFVVPHLAKIISHSPIFPADLV